MQEEADRQAATTTATGRRRMKQTVSRSVEASVVVQKKTSANSCLLFSLSSAAAVFESHQLDSGVRVDSAECAVCSADWATERVEHTRQQVKQQQTKAVAR